LLAAWVPALRALATDPSILLREGYASSVLQNQST